MTTPVAPAAPAAPRANTARGRLDHATGHLEPPLAVVDLDALDANAADLVRRAGDRPIRVASKSVRCRALLRRVLDRPGFAGVMAYTLAEALWLAGGNDPVSTDVLVGYPTVDRAALRRLGADEQLADRVTLMVDSVAHLDLLDAVVPPASRPVVRVCLDLDASWRVGPAHVGVRRSPVHAPAEAAALARAVVARPGVRLVGVMAYEAQIAGLGDAPAGHPVRGLAVRGMQRASVRELALRRAAAVAAVREVADLRFVNGGGTGSLERTAAEESVTELAAGSGLYSPALFDAYRSFRGRPAALFALPVTRRPAADVVTVAGGGWIASGPPGRDRSPTPVHPAGLRLLAAEGAGEMQTPLRGPGTAELEIGDRVWFRHAKAGELCERVDELHLLSGDSVTAVVPTYRGQGRAFG
ncbi:amino acid deaminase/aldolase [Modestobacter sp. SYSU DS0511]